MNNEFGFTIKQKGEKKSILNNKKGRIEIDNIFLPEKFKESEKVYITVSKNKDSRIDLLNKLLDDEKN
jgi:hypothetical protein